VPGAPVRGAVLTAPTVTYGQPSTLTVTTDQDGADRGAVEFKTDDKTSGPVKVKHHTATWQVPAVSLEAGSHQITAVFAPPEPDTEQVTRHATHEVLQAQTVITAKTDSMKPGATKTARLTGMVKGEHGTVPTGSVEVALEGTVQGTARLDDTGVYEFTLDVSSSRAVSGVTVSYPGDDNHVASKVSVDPDSGSTTPPSGGGEPSSKPAGPDGPDKPGGPDDPGKPAGPGGPDGPSGDGYGQSPGSGGAGGSMPGGGNGHGPLPFTGTSALWTAGLAAVLTGAGLVLRRRRRVD
jgi:hypothetical protein